MTQAEMEETATKVATKLARKYARHFPELEDDLVQVALLEAHRAAGRWRPEKGAKLSTYVWNAVQMTLWKAAVKMRQPMYGANHRINELAQVHWTSIDAPRRTGENDARRSHGHDDSFHVLQDDARDPEQEMARAQALQRLYEVILAQPAGRAAMAVLLDGESPQAVAARSAEHSRDERTGRYVRRAMTRAQVLEAVERARAAIAADSTLRECWLEAAS